MEYSHYIFIFEDHSNLTIRLENARSFGSIVSRSSAVGPTTGLTLFRVQLTYFQFSSRKHEVFCFCDSVIIIYYITSPNSDQIR